MRFVESETEEHKKSISQLDRALKTVCAFLNHRGGVIYFGVDRDGNVVGQQATDSNIKKISQQIRSKIKPQVLPTVKGITVEGKEIIEVRVERQNDGLYYLDGVPYKRSGTETVVMPPDEIKRKILDSARFEWDTEICEDAGIDDIDEEKVKAYLRLRGEKRGFSSEIKMSIPDFLTNIKALRDGRPTKAGILFFGRDPLRHIPHAQLRLARIKGDRIYSDIIDKEDCSGTLPEMVEQAESFIKRNIRYAGPRTDDFRRRDRYEYPIRALREAIINALIHRDYNVKADVRVFILDDRIEIVSPGEFPEGITPQRPRHLPVNPTLCSYMYDIGYIEKYGSGILLVRELCRENGNEEPLYDSGNGETKITFKSPFKTVDITEIVGKHALNERQITALEHIVRFGGITTARYMELTGISRITAKRDLLDMKAKHLIKFEGAPKTGRYVLLDTANDTVNDTANDTVNDTDGRD